MAAPGASRAAPRAPGAGEVGVNSPVYRLGVGEAYRLRLVLQLRARGYGTYRIGRLLWPSLKPRTAQKRVQRLLDWARRLGLPVDRPGEALAMLSPQPSDASGSPRGPPGRRRVETPTPPFVETRRRRVETGEDGSVGAAPPGAQAPVRLGPTQRLAIAALQSLGGRARLAAIVQEALSLLGLEGHLTPRARLRNRLWQALRRLARRGLVGHHGGVYWLQRPLGGPGLLAENFRAYTLGGRLVYIWSKREHGHPAPLEEALTIATLRGAVRVVQAEVAEALRSPELEAVMDELGVSEIKVYRDPSPPYRGRAKLEVVFNSGTPLKPSILELPAWAKAFQRVKEALLHALRRR